MQTVEKLVPMPIQKTGYVVQSNKLIYSKQNLNRQEAKLIRIAIMQVFRDDKEFKAYKIPLKEFCQLLNLDLDQYCGKNIHKICNGIAKKPLQMQSGNSWRIIPWVSICEYISKDEGKGEGMIIIKLNDELKPYLIGLEQCYTQYMVDYMLSFPSAYGIRIFEMLFSKIYSSDVPNEGAVVEASVEEIRLFCNCGDKYAAIGMFKKRVINKALEEINQCTIYDIHYVDIIENKKAVGFRFLIQKKFSKIDADISELLMKPSTKKSKKKKSSGENDWIQEELKFEA